MCEMCCLKFQWESIIHSDTYIWIHREQINVVCDEVHTLTMNVYVNKMKENKD